MQIVIDIPDRYITSDTCFNEWCKNAGSDFQMVAVLPKGHGDLIDRNSILCDDCSCEQCGHTDECFKLLAPTIIEADKAESEK